MHYYQNMSDYWGIISPYLTGGSAVGPLWGLTSLKRPNLPIPGENPAGAHDWSSPRKTLL